MLQTDPSLEPDSLDILELVMALEEAFDIEIPDHDAKKIRSVQDALDLIDRLKVEQEAKLPKKRNQ